MGFITSNAPIATSLVGTLPSTLPEPPDSASPDLLAYHQELVEWYSAFLIAYKNQQNQILSQIATP